jgi:hypothetical protein
VHPRATRAALVAVLGAVALVAGACGVMNTTAPPATPLDFPGILIELSARGVRAGSVVSGETGCDDPDLIGPAIAFDASGLDQADPVRLHVYIFRNAASYASLRGAVDACTTAYAAADGSVTALDAAPFVVAGTGSWAPEFTAAVREALIAAAGVGG